jgi:hypothetical protein
MTQDSEPKSQVIGSLRTLRVALDRVMPHLVISMLLWATVSWLIALKIIDQSKVFAFYKDSFRTPFFTGFLTLGSFLLSFKAFAIIRLSQIFDMQEYQDRFLKRKSIDKDFTDGYFDPLIHLSDSIFLAIFLALITAAAQLTLGLIPIWWTVLPCLWLAAFTGSVLFRTVHLLKRNIDGWLEIERVRQEKKLQARSDEINHSEDSSPK